VGPFDHESVDPAACLLQQGYGKRVRGDDGKKIWAQEWRKLTLSEIPRHKVDRGVITILCAP
jgi:hypothetical protein